MDKKVDYGTKLNKYDKDKKEYDKKMEERQKAINEFAKDHPECIE